MSETIQFRKVGFDAGGAPIGTATLEDDGELTYSGEAIRGIMAPTVARVGPEKAYRLFTDRSNGYVVSSPID